ncbi:preprotein translocase subunit YajC [Nocardia sp. NPDC127579]|uniref:preprotein translocase subunit YajC n=1 Tax=Nocardia sp. NPDC127579 TaxID=3345402 RepID=UPI0036290B1C
MDLLLIMAVGLAALMFFQFRSQRKHQAKMAEMQAGLVPGAGVITTSGLYGTVVEVDEDTVDLEIAEDVVTTWMRSAIREVRTEDAADAATGDEPEESAPAVEEAPAAAVETPAADEPADKPETRLTKD